jgi:transcriptional regulator with XRE-family HTH domain
MPDWHIYFSILPHRQIKSVNSVYLTLPYSQIAHDNPDMDIGRAIYALRKEKGLKLEEVALDAGTDSGHLSRIETGSRKPSLAMLEKIATAMGVRISLIVTMAEGESMSNATGQVPNLGEADLSEESIQLRQYFRTLSSDNQRALLEIAKVLKRLQRDG